jgi:hypothetical protein
MLRVRPVARDGAKVCSVVNDKYRTFDGHLVPGVGQCPSRWQEVRHVIHLFLGRSVSQCQGVIQTSYPVSDGKELFIRNAPGTTNISLSCLWCGKSPWVQTLASSFIFVQVGKEALGEQVYKLPVVLGVREVVPSSKPTFQQLQALP